MIRLLYAAALVAALAGQAIAGELPSTPIEADAQIGKDVSAAAIDALATLIRADGWGCDSISSVDRRTVVYDGFEVLCNHARYRYIVEDDHGRVKITSR